MKAENNQKVPKIKLNKLTKEAEDMLQNSYSSFSKQQPDKIKAEESGVYDNFTPRSLRQQQASKYAEASSDSDSDSESPKKARNKFFKATEKERDEEKRKLRELRKRKTDEDNFEPEGFSLGKRRKKEPTPPPQSPEPFVPKKVTRKVERKLVAMIPKIDAEELMEESVFKRFNKVVEVIFENMEDINMKELEQMEEGAEIPPEILVRINTQCR